MNADPVQRVLLAGILGCMVILAVQGSRGPGQSAAARYRVSVIKSKDPWLMRVDSMTGQVEQFKVRGAREWVVLGDAEEIDLDETERDTSADTGPAPAPEESEPAEPRLARERPPSPERAPEPPAPTPAVPPAPTPVTLDSRSEIAALSDALDPKNPKEIRLWAAQLLGTYATDAPDASVPALIGALDDSDNEVVIAAVRSLGASGSRSARPAVEGLLDHPDAQVQAAAREAAAELP